MTSHSWSEGNKRTSFHKPFPHSDVFKIHFHTLHLRLGLVSGFFLQVYILPPKSGCTSRLSNMNHVPLATHVPVFYHPNTRSIR